MKFVLGFALGIVTVVVAGLAFIYSGVYNVAATDAHNPAVRWALHTTMHRSINARGENIQVPAAFDEAQVRRGSRKFDEICVTCHGGPGVSSSAIGAGLRPDPPDLSEKVQQWSRAELFWIVKNGIKMTGMPGLGPTHSDEDLWAIVAFLDRLPVLSPEEYEQMTDDVRDPNAPAREQR